MNTITEREINLIKRRLNNSTELGNMQTAFDLATEDGIEVTEPQATKGFDWLFNMYKTPEGRIRKNNPFGTNEEDALNSGLDYFTFDGMFNAGNGFVNYYMPIYTFHGKNGGEFQYYGGMGRFEIIG